MPKEVPSTHLSLALNTTLEREFVSPLTSIRIALEILRDFPDLTNAENDRFLRNAIEDCTRLELGVEHLASTVYAAVGLQPEEHSEGQQAVSQPEENSEYADRIQFIEDSQIIEIDFSQFVFTSSKIVNEFYDQLDQSIEKTGHRWYIVVNYHNCKIWPEAWFAFAHRGKKVNVSYSLGTVRYFDAAAIDDNRSISNDPDLLASRDEALAQIELIRKASSD